jgi:RNA polymerase sigma factor (sigma-70 family)
MAGGVAERAIRQESTRDVDGAPPDEVLLAQFIDGEGFASEDAFRLLVERHGPRVLGICRHILDREHDSEDAFQATFLALARNGASIRERCALAGWLHEVAYRTAIKTRTRRSRRQTVERQVMVLRPPPEEPDDQGERASLAELRPVLHEEVTGLPDKYRIPVVLSYLEGKTNEEVAALLKWPVGTVKGRLSRGRALLRSRLTRRGVALSAGTLLVALSRARATAADVPAELVRRTLGLAVGSGLPGAAAGSASTPAPPSSDVTDSGGHTTTDARTGGDPVSNTPATPRHGPVESDVSEQGPSPPLADPTGSRLERTGMLASATLLLLLAFAAAIFVGGFVSSAAYGGKLLDLRSAFRGLMPTWKSAPGSCHGDSIR